VTHYSEAVNSYMVSCFKNGNNRVTSETIDEHHRAFLSLPEETFL
jgi:hypothetical protein